MAVREPLVCGRRVALVAGAGGLVVLAGCGSGAGASGGGSTVTGGGGGSVPAASVPVGGGVIVADQGFLVTQPTAGQFRAFSVVCPHQGCPVSQITNGQIVCPCHGSQFSVADGSVTQGPAPTGLKALKVSDSGGTLTVS